MAGQYIATTPFPNTTTLYGWAINAGSDGATITNAFGSKDLTRTGALTARTDHLIASTFCDFDGTNDNLVSTDAAFNFTGSFSIGGWFCSDSWAAVGGYYFISRAEFGGLNGWILYQAGGGSKQIGFNTYSAGVNTSALLGSAHTFVDSTWHHIAVVRTSGSKAELYLDGILNTTNSDATDTITAGGNLEVGSVDGGTTRFDGGIQDVFVHNGTALSADDIRNIYRWGVGRGVLLS